MGDGWAYFGSEKNTKPVLSERSQRLITYRLATCSSKPFTSACSRHVGPPVTQDSDFGRLTEVNAVDNKGAGRHVRSPSR